MLTNILFALRARRLAAAAAAVVVAGTLMTAAASPALAGQPRSIATWVKQVERKIDSTLVYPRSMMRESAHGTVFVDLSVNPDGSIADVAVSQSSGHSSFDREALRVARALGKLPPLPGRIGTSDVTMAVSFGVAGSEAEARRLSIEFAEARAQARVRTMAALGSR